MLSEQIQKIPLNSPSYHYYLEHLYASKRSIQNMSAYIKLIKYMYKSQGHDMINIYKHFVNRTIALRMAKTPSSFGHSECNRVK